MKHIFSNTTGFSFIELIVVIFIFTLITVGGVITYNSFTQSFDLSNAEEFVLSIIDEKKLNVLNGRSNCAKALFFQDESYFLTIEHKEPNCKSMVPLVNKFGLNKENELRIQFRSTENSKVIERIESQGNIQRIDVDAGEEKHFLELSDSQYYRFVIYEDGNQANTESVWGLYYFSEKNVDIENVDHVVAQNVTAVDLNNQVQDGKVMRIEFEYPEGKAKSYLDESIMRHGILILNKQGTVLDPIDIPFENF